MRAMRTVYAPKKLTLSQQVSNKTCRNTAFVSLFRKYSSSCASFWGHAYTIRKWMRNFHKSQVLTNFCIQMKGCHSPMLSLGSIDVDNASNDAHLEIDLFDKLLHRYSICDNPDMTVEYFYLNVPWDTCHSTVHLSWQDFPQVPQNTCSCAVFLNSMASSRDHNIDIDIQLQRLQQHWRTGPCS